MSDVFVGPGVLNGRITPPPSKSDAHRALICAALAGKPDSLDGLEPPFSEDLLATKSCLAAFTQPGAVLDCGESGTTLRLILPIAAALGRQSRFVGHGRLPARPLREYEQILGPHGIEFDFPTVGSLPLEISGQLRAGDYSLRGDISSQYLSGLLLALPLLAGDSKINLTTPLESAPYVEMTINTMRRFGVQVEQSTASSVPGGQFIVPGGQKYQPTAYAVERDYSQAAFWLTANFCGSNVQVEGLSADSCQGDKRIVEILAEFSSGQAAGRGIYT
ncbi:MAG: 3-phosphoshikimate 1-carboxyvinyltransferase, partial [Ruminococcaceae bacterium]|nr:3-phosphoshikimate 1-carboxyvinyltransferase [Oscillospiraceae bacterium]